ncbi:uncharacterized protein LOC135208427 [Macrobrachium nipponense]|uniref:uncharacterized protein LOC135208427 n=1 Tax=Macrobrachium nipponense TaxID=159736 RepID=UPI0030C7DBBB
MRFLLNLTNTREKSLPAGCLEPGHSCSHLHQVTVTPITFFVVAISETTKQMANYINFDTIGEIHGSENSDLDIVNVTYCNGQFSVPHLDINGCFIYHSWNDLSSSGLHFRDHMQGSRAQEGNGMYSEGSAFDDRNAAKEANSDIKLSDQQDSKQEAEAKLKIKKPTDGK